MELLTVQETARLLKVSPVTVRRHIKAGHLAAVRVGKTIRVRKEALDDFVQPLGGGWDDEAPGVNYRGPFTTDDPLFSIIGRAQAADGTTDVSENKHKYLAASLLAEFHEPEAE